LLLLLSYGLFVPLGVGKGDGSFEGAGVEPPIDLEGREVLLAVELGVGDSDGGHDVVGKALGKADGCTDAEGLKVGCEVEMEILEGFKLGCGVG
jgi:hypothetical protein